MSNETENRRRLFSRGDFFWFLLLPLFMSVGYFGFRYYENADPDPNLRLVAKFSDDVSVELKGVAFSAEVGGSGTRWWKPNGLPFPEFKPDTRSFRPRRESDNPRMVVFEMTGSGKVAPKCRIKPRVPEGKDMSCVTSFQELHMFLKCSVDEGYFASNSFLFEVASRGIQSIAQLTPDEPKVEVVLAGVNAKFETMKSEDGKGWEVKLSGPPGVDFSRQPLLKRMAMMSQIGLNCSFEPGSSPVRAEPNFNRKEYYTPKVCEFFWTIPKQDWTHIEITFIDYDQIAEFKNVSVHPGVFTIPSLTDARSTKSQ